MFLPLGKPGVVHRTYLRHSFQVIALLHLYLWDSLKKKNTGHTLVSVAWRVSHQCTTCSVTLQEENVYHDLIFWNSAVDSVTKKWEVSHLNKLILFSRYLGYDGTTNNKCSLASHLGHMGETASQYPKEVGSTRPHVRGSRTFTAPWHSPLGHGSSDCWLPSVNWSNSLNQNLTVKTEFTIYFNGEAQNLSRPHRLHFSLLLKVYVALFCFNCQVDIA